MNFLKHSMCKGAMPRHLLGQTYFIRNSLLACMMRNRSIVRYICAPFGFGKSMLACSYADLVNQFEHTFWLDGTNPCFLRDLDARTLLPDLLSTSDVGDLVIIDDVPYLGAGRRSALWDLCRGLTQGKREVVVCATPSADPLCDNRQDCICLGPRDLLYNDKDWEILRGKGVYPRKDIPGQSPVIHIPLLAQPDAEKTSAFLQEHIHEMDDPAQCALSFAMLVLERGTFDQLEEVLGREVTYASIDTTGVRPFVQADAYSNEFVAHGFMLSEVIRAFVPHIATISREAGCDDASELSVHLADALLEQRQAEKAAQILLRLCDTTRRAAWLTDHQDYLFDTGALAAAEDIYTSLNRQRLSVGPVLFAASCVRRSFIDHTDGVIEELSGIVGKVDYPLAQRLFAAAYACLHSEDAQQVRDIETTMSSQLKGTKREVKKLDEAAAALWEYFARLDVATARLDEVAASVGARAGGVLALACCAHRARLEGVVAADLVHLDAMIAHAFSADAPASGTAAFAMLRREADALGVKLDMSSMSVMAAYQDCDAFEDSLEIQSAAYARAKAAKLGAISASLRAQAARTSLARDKHKGAIPILNARLFGQFDIKIGEAPVDPSFFRRHKVRMLLALLIIESGRELSCDNLATRLWPDSLDFRARHNFYNAVSILRRGIALDDGTCPYLIRGHGVVSIEKSLVKSDVGRVGELCKRLRFSEPDPALYGHIFEEIRDLMVGELMPSENAEAMLVAAREEWKNRVVNTFLYAARRLQEIGERDLSLQLAEQALSYAPQREDCYEFLIAMQTRCGQRPAAIDTWTRYRTFLNEELGLDPSSRASQLYQRILRDER